MDEPVLRPTPCNSALLCQSRTTPWPRAWHTNTNSRPLGLTVGWDTGGGGGRVVGEQGPTLQGSCRLQPAPGLLPHPGSHLGSPPTPSPRRLQALLSLSVPSGLLPPTAGWPTPHTGLWDCRNHLPLAGEASSGADHGPSHCASCCTCSRKVCHFSKCCWREGRRGRQESSHHGRPKRGPGHLGRWKARPWPAAAKEGPHPFQLWPFTLWPGDGHPKDSCLGSREPSRNKELGGRILSHEPSVWLATEMRSPSLRTRLLFFALQR